MRRFWTASVTAMAVTFLAAPASAQTPWSASGEITDSDAGGAEPHYDDHSLRLEAGQRYRISVDSDAFDAVGRLYAPGSEQPVAENDDGEGLNPRITFAPTASGDYRLRVSGFSAAGRGAYTASLATLPPLPPARALPLEASGRIEAGGEGGSPRYDEYVLRLEAGQRYIIRVASSDFDSLARLLQAGSEAVVAENDDDGEGLNSRISFVPSESGDYVLRAGPLAAEGRGAYTVSAEPAPPLPAPQSVFNRMQMAPWQVYDGTLTSRDGEGTNGARVDDYLVHFDAGQERMIALDSPDFDTVVQVLRVDAREGGEPLASNDDNGNVLSSLMIFRAEEAGDYIIRVTAFSADGRGSYRLRVSQ